jgi:hypothetical protein
MKRLRRLGVAMTAGTLAAGAALAIAPPASASSKTCVRAQDLHHIYGDFCINIKGKNRHVESISTSGDRWNGYIVVTIKNPSDPSGKALYKNRTVFKWYDGGKVFKVNHTYPNGSKACIAWHLSSKLPKPSHMVATACGYIFDKHR